MIRTIAEILLAIAVRVVSPSGSEIDQGLPSEVVSPSPSNTQAWNQYIADGWDSPFGLDYVFVLDPGFQSPDLARELGGFIGVRWVNFAKINWGTLEPRAPVGGKHSYNWSKLDEGVQQWQKYGIHIMMSLRFVSPWANATPKGNQFTYLDGPWALIPKGVGDYIPTPEHQQDLRDYIQHLVERYDGDGKEDMPGLLFPILYYQVCNEAYNELFWAGTVEEYGAHLKEVAQAAHQANPKVKIILSGVCFQPMSGYYDKQMDPRTKAYVEKLLPKTAPKMIPFLKRMDEFSRRSLTFPEYDILDARWSSYGVVAQCKEELRLAGRPDTEVWSAEIYSAFPLLDAMILPMTTLYSYPTPSRSLDYIRITRSPKDKDFGVVNRWYRGLQASMVVKNCMVGLEAGSKKLMNGWALDSQVPVAPYPLGVGGYKSTTFNCLWPAAYTYKLLIEKLDGITSCRRLPVVPDVYVYQCTVHNGRRVLVAFYDDHIGQNHNEALGTIPVKIPFGGVSARLTHIITEIGQTHPEVEQLKSNAGVLQVTLSEFPVFIE